MGVFEYRVGFAGVMTAMRCVTGHFEGVSEPQIKKLLDDGVPTHSTACSIGKLHWHIATGVHPNILQQRLQFGGFRVNFQLTMLLKAFDDEKAAAVGVNGLTGGRKKRSLEEALGEVREEFQAKLRKANGEPEAEAVGEPV